MTLRNCSRNKELGSLLNRGHWPLAATEEMRLHIQSCKPCSNLLRITQAFQNSKLEAMRSADTNLSRLPSPGLLWWRAQLRRRDEALRQVSKPIFGAQIFAISINVLILLGIVLTQAAHGVEWITRLSEYEPSTPLISAIHLEALWPAIPSGSAWSLSTLILSIFLLVFLAGLVVYLASEKS